MSGSTQKPLVTVIISSYNHAAYVADSIRSVQCQSYPNIELLVVDDGSTDDSVAVIQTLREQRSFDFRVQQNKGLARTLNDCIARATGDLIAPFGSDDIMCPDRIEKQVAYLDGKPEVGVCAGNIEQIDGSGKVLVDRNRERPFRRLDFQALFLGTMDGAPAPTLMLRRSVLVAVGGYDPSIQLEDLPVLLKIAQAGYFIDVLPDVLAQYRVHLTNSYKNHRMMVENVLKTYSQFHDHPAYFQVRARFINSMILKCARHDKILAHELLRQLPLTCWNTKTLRALWRLLIG